MRVCTKITLEYAESMLLEINKQIDEANKLKSLSSDTKLIEEQEMYLRDFLSTKETIEECISRILENKKGNN